MVEYSRPREWQIIDGRASVAAHGALEEPVWATVTALELRQAKAAAEVEQRARGQISRALVEYLETIQEK